MICCHNGRIELHSYKPRVMGDNYSSRVLAEPIFALACKDLSMNSLISPVTSSFNLLSIMVKLDPTDENSQIMFIQFIKIQLRNEC